MSLSVNKKKKKLFKGDAMTGPESKEPSTQPEPPMKGGPKQPNSKQSLVQFVKENVFESIAYVIMFCGLIFSIFNPFLGGLLVGLILGIYFSQRVIDRLNAFKGFIATEGIFHGFIIVVALLALLIQAPGLLIGTLIGAWVRPFLGNTITSPFDKQE